jgi:L-iditol 2-dehydrogenase
VALELQRLLPSSLTHTFGIDAVQTAFELACRSAFGRVKIAIAESGSA